MADLMKIYSLDKTDFSSLLAVKKDSFHNSFFYSVRNITIAYFLSEIESYFLGKGHFVQCKWSESSFGGPSIKITLFNPKTKKEYYESSIILKRDSHHLYHDINANVYSIKNISTTSYFRFKISSQT